MLIRRLRSWSLQKYLKQVVRAADVFPQASLSLFGSEPCGSGRPVGFAGGGVPARPLMYLEHHSKRRLAELPDFDRAARLKVKALELSRRLICRW